MVGYQDALAAPGDLHVAMQRRSARRLRTIEPDRRLAGIVRRGAQGLLPWTCALGISVTLASALNIAVASAWPADPGTHAAAVAPSDACTLQADLALYAHLDEQMPALASGVCGIGR